MPPVIYGLGGGHTHTHFGGMKVISKNQVRWPPGLKGLIAIVLKCKAV